MSSGSLPVIFDLDGTLLDGDSTAAWMAARIRKSFVRVTAAVLAAPLAVPLTVFAPTRRLGGSLYLWIASFGFDEEDLKASFQAFAEKLSSDGKIAWHEEGLACLNAHITRGEHVIVATASPLWLADPIVHSLGKRVTVVGSIIKPLLGGWVASHHCRNRAKCAAILKAGHGAQWSAAYSDSIDDLPLLSQATQAFLVNGSGRARRRFQEAKIVVEHLAW